MKSTTRLLAVAAACFLAAPAQSVDFGDITRSLLRSNPSEALKRTAEREAIKELERVVSVSTASSSKRQDNVAYSGDANVIFYSRQGCGYCNKARAYFDNNGIQYRELDVERDEEARAQFQQFNARGVPLILVGDQQLNGWSESQFKRLYKQSAGTSPSNATKTTPVPSGELSRGATSVTPKGPTVVEEGAVLVAKISGVPLYAGPDKSEQVLSHLKKGEEVVVMGPVQSGLVPVRGSLHEGWVESLLLR